VRERLRERGYARELEGRICVVGKRQKMGEREWKRERRYVSLQDFIADYVGAVLYGVACTNTYITQ
jgi:hypothetical protein